jgi:hypothetical protein
MKSSLLFLGLVLCTHAALAEPPPPPPSELWTEVEQLVNKQLVTPLNKAQSKRSRFSRAAPVPVQRRVRVLDTVALTDTSGREFVRFAIDERRSFDEQAAWDEDSVIGCAYVHEREVFVQHGRAYRAANSLLGKDAKERAGVCRAVSAEAAS